MKEFREGKQLSNIKGHNPDAPSCPKPPPPRNPPKVAAETSGTGNVPRGYVPVSVVQALVERMDESLVCGEQSPVRYWRDELAKLARDYAPEVSQKSPSPRNP